MPSRRSCQAGVSRNRSSPKARSCRPSRVRRASACPRCRRSGRASANEHEGVSARRIVINLQIPPESKRTRAGEFELRRQLTRGPMVLPLKVHLSDGGRLDLLVSHHEAHRGSLRPREPNSDLYPVADALPRRAAFSTSSDPRARRRPFSGLGLSYGLSWTLPIRGLGAREPAPRWAGTRREPLAGTLGFRSEVDPTNEIQYVHHFTLRVSDLDRSRKFYSDVLGLDVEALDDRLRFAVGPTRIILRSPLEGTPGDDRFSEFRIGLDHISFGVEDRGSLGASR
jgi:hypothetical protein